MNKTAMIKAMTVSISEVLEQMFFLPIDTISADGDLPQAPPPPISIAARVGFEGEPSGTFRLNVPADLAASITADFLGTEPTQLSTQQITGTVKEMINMLAGNSLSAYDAQHPFDLKIPELVPADKAPDQGGAPNDAMGDPNTIDIGIETLDSRMTLHLATYQEAKP